MKNEEYQRLHDLPKELDDYNINMAAQFTQVSMSGHGKFNTKEKFTVSNNLV